MPPYSILLIDNDPAYCRRVVESAKRHRLIVTCHHNLKEGMDELMKNRRLKAVILDDRCGLTAWQSGEGQSNFVFHAMRQLGEIEYQYHRVVPYCVSCENTEEFKEDLDGITVVFRKDVDHDQMFQWITVSIDNLPETIIQKEYAGIFEKLSGIFDENQEALLVDVLQLRGTGEPAAIITGMVILRRLMENLADVACTIHLDKKPESYCIEGAGGRTKLILLDLQTKVLPVELHFQATQFYKICSKYASHIPLAPTEGPSFHPKKYTLGRLIYTFLELVDYLIPVKTSVKPL